LGPHVVIDPPAILREARHLGELGVEDPTALLTVHPRCLVTTFWHRALNQSREASRGANKHGSCGQGIGEARSYWLRYGDDAVFAADLHEPDALRGQPELQRQRALLELQELIDRIGDDGVPELDVWYLDTESVAAGLGDAARG